jgi:hypothetical protein
MKMSHFVRSGLCGMAAIGSYWAWADEIPAISATMEGRSLYDQIAEKAAINYYGSFRGPQLRDLGNAAQPDTQGTPNTDNPISLESKLTTGYKLNKDTVVGVLTHFFYYPVGYPIGTGQNIQMYDPGFIFRKSNLIQKNGFNVSTRVVANLPLFAADMLVSQNLATSITPALITTYEIPRIPITLGIFSYLRGYIPTPHSIPGHSTYEIYIAPNASYQFSKSVAATLWVDLIQVSRKEGTPFFTGMDNAMMDVEPGIMWDITKNISINPILNIYPSNMSLAATSIQANLIANAF